MIHSIRFYHTTLLRKNKVKNCYLIILIIGLFIQSLCSYFSSAMYFVTAFIIYLLLIIYSLMSKDEFSKNLLDALCILSLSSVLIGLNNYTLISSLITTILLIIFSILNKTNNKNYIRVAIRNFEDNNKLISALKEIL